MATEALLASLIAAIPAALAWLEGRRNKVAIQEIHVKINSRMDQLLGAMGARERAAGRLEGIADQQAKEHP